ncbi:ABC transporter permease [Streptococcus zalophi]|uniref:ABC transporter permease n=1 Tax=Streptococcus zalophi TaxID=640031 RepID=UPI00215BCD7F|nr:ABC transporter permease [Streptococcus zalophi]MCR8967852.1 ABC transporter permease [Streptococcus zalophi]
MRILYMIKKELRCSKENISFHLVSIISPLLFILAFTLMLSGGITFPLQVQTDNKIDGFDKFLERYSSPSGENYFEINTIDNKEKLVNINNNFLKINKDLSVEDKKISGEMTLYINDANANMTKNYRNRVNGALLEYINLNQNEKINVKEVPRYAHDIPWDKAFGVSVFAFGIALSGLLFGMLSMTHEWEDKTNKFIKLSPRGKGTLILAKGISSIIKSFISSSIFILVYFSLFKNMPSDLGVLIATVALSSIIFIFIGMIIGHYIKSTITSFLVSMIAALTLWIGGGGFGPLSYFGTITNILGKINPITYILELLRFTYFMGNINVSHHIVILLLFSGVAYIVLKITFDNWCRKEVIL